MHRKRTGLPLALVDFEGRVLAGDYGRGVVLPAELCVQAVAEARCWGEPCVMCGQDERLVWALPIAVNQKLLGGLVVCGGRLIRPRKSGAFDRRVRAACAVLVELAAEHNLVNLAELAQRRSEAERERDKAKRLVSCRVGVGTSFWK